MEVPRTFQSETSNRVQMLNVHPTSNRTQLTVFKKYSIHSCEIELTKNELNWSDYEVNWIELN